MRSFEYSFNGAEVTIKILSGSGSTICEAKFPTPAAASTYAVQDVNWHLGQHSQPLLEDAEKTSLLNIVAENT